MGMAAAVSVLGLAASSHARGEFCIISIMRVSLVLCLPRHIWFGKQYNALFSFTIHLDDEWMGHAHVAQ